MSETLKEQYAKAFEEFAYQIHPMNLTLKEKIFATDQISYYVEYCGIYKIESHYTGGGCWHLFLFLMNGHIVNITDGSAETSFLAYNNIKEYFDTGDFGMEYEKPNYELRLNEKLGEGGNFPESERSLTSPIKVIGCQAKTDSVLEQIKNTHTK
jgi:hypothetical protein